MLQKCILRRNDLRIKLVKQYAEERKVLVTKLRKAKSLKEIVEARKNLNILPKDSSSIRIRKRCFVTGRGRGNLRVFGMCRHQILQYVYQGNIYGWKSSSW